MLLACPRQSCTREGHHGSTRQLLQQGLAVHNEPQQHIQSCKHSAGSHTKEQQDLTAVSELVKHSWLTREDEDIVGLPWDQLLPLVLIGLKRGPCRQLRQALGRQVDMCSPKGDCCRVGRQGAAGRVAGSEIAKAEDLDI